MTCFGIDCFYGYNVTSVFVEINKILLA